MRTLGYVVVGLLVWCAVARPAPPGPAGGASGGGGLVLLLAVGVVAATLAAARLRARHGHTTTSVRRGIRGRHVTVRTEPARGVAPHRRIATAAKHEAGHKAVAQARGWRVLGVQVNPDGSGVTRMYVPDRRYDPRDDIAVSLGGWLGSGTRDGCGSDFAHAEAARLSLPESERGAGWREGERRCRSALWWRSGQRRRDTAALIDRGQL